MTTFLKSVYKFIEQNHLFNDGEQLLVGISGGVDSVVLFDLLKNLSKQHRWQLAVAHFNHQLRGEASEGDAEFVRELAREAGAGFTLGCENVAELSKAKRISIEMAARELRHEFFAKSAGEFGARKIVLAHHADDQIELFFLRMLRGSGGRGLGGMKPVAPSPINPHLLLVRPLLEASKTEILNYAKSRNLKFRRDASNDQNDAVRNRIRNKLLPSVRERFGNGFEKTVPRAMRLIESEHDCIREIAISWLEKKKPAFSDLHPAVGRQVLVQQLRDNKLEPDFRLVEHLYLEPDQPFSIADNTFVKRDHSGNVEVFQEDETSSPNLNKMEVVFSSGEGQFEFDGIEVAWKKISHEQLSSSNPEKKANTEWFDADKIGDQIKLRHWRAGDRMQPIGMCAAVKLQDIFVNQPVPRLERNKRVLAESERGEIFWVEGLRISEQVKFDDQTKIFLKWHWARR